MPEALPADEDGPGEIVPHPHAELVREAGVPGLLDQIRPQWQAKSLVQRVRRLLEVDPSSACQRLFNAAIHDLKEEVVIAGVDIAQEAARQHKLPPVDKPDDVENYSTTNVIALAYRIGLLSRAEWRRLSRCTGVSRGSTASRHVPQHGPYLDAQHPKLRCSQR